MFKSRTAAHKAALKIQKLKFYSVTDIVRHFQNKMGKKKKSKKNKARAGDDKEAPSTAVPASAEGNGSNGTNGVGKTSKKGGKSAKAEKKEKTVNKTNSRTLAASKPRMRGQAAVVVDATEVNHACVCMCDRVRVGVC